MCSKTPLPRLENGWDEFNQIIQATESVPIRQMQGKYLTGSLRMAKDRLAARAMLFSG